MFKTGQLLYRIVVETLHIRLRRKGSFDEAGRGRLRDDHRRLTRAPLAVVLACLLEPHITHAKMSSGYGLTGGMCMCERGCARAEELAEAGLASLALGLEEEQGSMLTTPDRATRSLTMLSLLAGRARLLRRQHLD